VAVTFVAVVEAAMNEVPAILVTTEPVPTGLDRGEAGFVTIGLLPMRDILEWKQTRGFSAQATLGVLKVAFSDGDDWTLTPPSGATSNDEVFMLPRPSVSRELLSLTAPPARRGALCLDDRGLAYSTGAELTIRGEKGARARCTYGKWVEVKAPQPPTR
jgi:hypothetical protein